MEKTINEFYAYKGTIKLSDFCKEKNRAVVSKISVVFYKNQAIDCLLMIYGFLCEVEICIKQVVAIFLEAERVW